MIPTDKHGRPIYPSTFKKLLQKGRTLESLGYFEAAEKPNLFHRAHKNRRIQVIFFADMRSFKRLPIWTDPRPVFYWTFEPASQEYELEVRQRVVHMEWERLNEVPKRFPPRLSFQRKREARLIVTEHDKRWEGRQFI